MYVRVNAMVVSTVDLSVVALCILAAVTSGQESSVTDIQEAEAPRGIVGGINATIEGHGYQAAILIRENLQCSGTIINPNWVLTAAHCCKDVRPSTVTLRVGTSVYNNGGDAYYVEKISYHHNYNTNTTDYDICAMKTTQPIRLRRSVRAIAMVSEEDAYTAGDIATVSGWGKLDALDHHLSDQLQVVQVAVISEEQCRQSYGRMNLAHQITERQICAGSPQGGRDACQGDSGGPMVINGKLAGIVSWGRGCGDRHYPGVYANVAALRDWIRRMTGV